MQLKVTFQNASVGIVGEKLRMYNRDLMSAIKRFLMILAVMVSPLWILQALPAAQRLPNFVIIFADDLGYGDLSCYGHPAISTPNLDRMADEGMRFTQFYSAASVCSPSRAALLTGRYQIRSGITRVLQPLDRVGLPADEITFAEALKSKGYATACIGKWHLGQLPWSLPTRQGFDYYFGLPYSNNMSPSVPGREHYPPLPLVRNEEVIETEPKQWQLTPRYTEEAVSFIKQNKDKPFLVYMPHTFPHGPLFASPRFKGKSLYGLYGDVVEELDWSVGEILDTLRELQLVDNTLVFFTSDNGAVARRPDGGCVGLLTGKKGNVFEGGIREPAIAWWPGRVPAGSVSRDVAITIDLFTTVLALGGVEIPKDRPIDGVNLVPVLEGKKPVAKRTLFFYRGDDLQAVRRGPWKLIYLKKSSASTRHFRPVRTNSPQLFQIEHDPSEKVNLAKEHPEIVAELVKEIERFKAGLSK